MVCCLVPAEQAFNLLGLGYGRHCTERRSRGYECKLCLISRALVLMDPSGTETLVVIVSKDWFYALRPDREAYNAALTSGVEIGDEGVEAAFEVIADVSERCVSAYAFERLTDMVPTVSRLLGGQATASSIPTLSND